MTTNPGRTVTDVMTPALITVPVTASVYAAAAAMRENDVGDVLVMDGQHVHGVVTDRDLVIRALAMRLPPESTAVADICSTDVAMVPPEAGIDVAVNLMRERAIRRIPVVDPDGRVLGIVSVGDLAVSRDPRSALADISAAPPNA